MTENSLQARQGERRKTGRTKKKKTPPKKKQNKNTPTPKKKQKQNTTPPKKRCDARARRVRYSFMLKK